MSDPRVEAAARAMFDTQDHGWTWEREDDLTRENYRTLARAALSADDPHREELIEALWECMKAAGADTSYADDADHAYRLGHLPDSAVRAVRELRQDYIDAGGG